VRHRLTFSRDPSVTCQSHVSHMSVCIPAMTTIFLFNLCNFGCFGFRTGQPVNSPQPINDVPFQQVSGNDLKFVAPVGHEVPAC
jgi:hypothetical protein